jgi:hypothetical protein
LGGGVEARDGGSGAAGGGVVVVVVFFFDPFSRSVCFVEAVVHFRAVLSRSALLNDLLDHAFECADAVAPLAVPG